MKIQYKNQKFQEEAAKAVVDVFEGQPCLNTKYLVDTGYALTDLEQTGWNNAPVIPDLTDAKVLAKLNQIQRANQIKPSAKLEGRYNLTIEMETGVGKTYTYIKTMYELNKAYGWCKFIVVVPSVAIREGVSKSFQTTEEHFDQEYGKKIRYFIYNSSQLSKIDNFATDAQINVMIINSQAFNATGKDARRIYMKLDEFRSRKPIDVIAKTNPIVIIDEPQSVEGEKTKERLKEFHPLLTLRYSATHRKDSIYNMIYRLDAMEAYNKRLVKKIRVTGISQNGTTATDSYVYLEGINLSSGNPTATIQFDCKGEKSVRKINRIVNEGFNLYDKSNGMEEYKDNFTVSKIDGRDNSITFVNGIKIFAGDVIGKVNEDNIRAIQIRETIKAHLECERKLFSRGIKVLSLFFIDEVENYRVYGKGGEVSNGKYADMFEEQYKLAVEELKGELDLTPEYIAYLDSIDANKTHNGYFSKDKKGNFTDSKLTDKKEKTSDDVDAYDLIMKDKERLLSFDEPVRFIFSHSALREGWDNPNVFQICSLRQSNSASQKRQEVGRGLRLCVDYHGTRMDDQTLQDEVQTVNKLTVIASEGYASFVADLQKDIKADLYDRPTKADVDFFIGKVLLGTDGQKHKVSKEDAQEIFFKVRMHNYITKGGEVTDVFREDLKNDKLRQLPDELAPLSDAVYKHVQSIFDSKVLDDMIEDGSNLQTPPNKLNDNFAKKEFQELWNRINHKYAYKVSFDSQELIDKAVIAIDKELEVAQLTYVITKGSQKEDLRKEDFVSGEMLKIESSQTDRLKTDVISHVKYDLIGKIASGTTLTRKTVATILTKIRPMKFDMFKVNPEEFITKTTRLILEQKATMIIDHISYNQVDGEYDSAIFTQEKHTSMDKAFKAEKSIMDYVFTDGTAENNNERKFVENLDISSEVVVYAKLPKGFHIPTPVGNYTPDWAIAFEKGKVKHIYFIAETKGSMSSMELRQIENEKIACAERLFKQLSTSEVMFDKVDSFDKLMSLVK